jgi:hypothetical protein
MNQKFGTYKMDTSVGNGEVITTNGNSNKRNKIDSAAKQEVCDFIPYRPSLPIEAPGAVTPDPGANADCNRSATKQGARIPKLSQIMAPCPELDSVVQHKAADDLKGCEVLPYTGFTEHPFASLSRGITLGWMLKRCLTVRRGQETTGIVVLNVGGNYCNVFHWLSQYRKRVYIKIGGKIVTMDEFRGSDEEFLELWKRDKYASKHHLLMKVIIVQPKVLPEDATASKTTPVDYINVINGKVEDLDLNSITYHIAILNHVIYYLNEDILEYVIINSQFKLLMSGHHPVYTVGECQMQLRCYNDINIRCEDGNISFCAGSDKNYQHNDLQWLLQSRLTIYRSFTRPNLFCEVLDFTPSGGIKNVPLMTNDVKELVVQKASWPITMSVIRSCCPLVTWPLVDIVAKRFGLTRNLRVIVPTVILNEALKRNVASMQSANAMRELTRMLRTKFPELDDLKLAAIVQRAITDDTNMSLWSKVSSTHSTFEMVGQVQQSMSTLGSRQTYGSMVTSALKSTFKIGVVAGGITITSMLLSRLKPVRYFATTLMKKVLPNIFHIGLGVTKHSLPLVTGVALATTGLLVYLKRHRKHELVVPTLVDYNSTPFREYPSIIPTNYSSHDFIKFPKVLWANKTKIPKQCSARVLIDPSSDMDIKPHPQTFGGVLTGPYMNKLMPTICYQNQKSFLSGLQCRLLRDNSEGDVGVRNAWLKLWQQNVCPNKIKLIRDIIDVDKQSWIDNQTTDVKHRLQQYYTDSTVLDVKHKGNYARSTFPKCEKELNCSTTDIEKLHALFDVSEVDDEDAIAEVPGFSRAICGLQVPAFSDVAAFQLYSVQKADASINYDIATGQRPLHSVEFISVSGMDQSDMGKLFTRCHNDGYIYAMCSDKSKFDSSVTTHALEYEFKFYESVLGKNAELSALKDSQMVRDLNSRYGVRVKSLKGRRNSGDPNTTIGNCVLVGATAKSITNNVLQDDTGQMSVVIDMGDDLCVLLKQQLNEQQSYLWVQQSRSYGFNEKFLTLCDSFYNIDFISARLVPANVDGARQFVFVPHLKCLSKLAFTKSPRALGNPQGLAIAIAKACTRIFKADYYIHRIIQIWLNKLEATYTGRQLDVELDMFYALRTSSNKNQKNVQPLLQELDEANNIRYGTSYLLQIKQFISDYEADPHLILAMDFSEDILRRDLS